MPTFKIQTGLRLIEPDLKKITFIAKRNKRSFNSQVEILVQSHIEQYEKKHGKIKVSEEE
jgi:hypothetical protein